MTYNGSWSWYCQLYGKKEQTLLTMQFEEGFGVELLWIQTVCLFPHLSQLSNATLKRTQKEIVKQRVTLVYFYWELCRLLTRHEISCTKKHSTLLSCHIQKHLINLFSCEHFSYHNLSGRLTHLDFYKATAEHSPPPQLQPSNFKAINTSETRLIKKVDKE